MRHSDKTLRRRLVDALRPLAERDTRLLLNNEDPPFISAFVARHRETISELSMPAAGLVIVIEGRKEVLWAPNVISTTPVTPSYCRPVRRSTLSTNQMQTLASIAPCSSASLVPWSLRRRAFGHNSSCAKCPRLFHHNQSNTLLGNHP